MIVCYSYFNVGVRVQVVKKKINELAQIICTRYQYRHRSRNIKKVIKDVPSK